MRTTRAISGYVSRLLVKNLRINKIPSPKVRQVMHNELPLLRRNMPVPTSLVIVPVVNNYSTTLITKQVKSHPAMRRSYHSTVSSLPSWIPGNKNGMLILDKILARQEKSILQSAEKNVGKFFLKVRKEMLEATLNENDFSYMIFEPVLKRLMLGMAIQFENELLDKHSQINHFINEANSLLAAKIPYKKTMRFMVRYLHYIDEMFLKIHPELSSNFHRNNAEHVLETLLSRAPNVLLFPSFEEVDINYFLNTRAAPFHIVGIDITGLNPEERVPYADGFPMKPSEFFWHDIGHDEFMENSDYAYIISIFKPIERVIQEWAFTSYRISRYLESIQENINLLDATKLILFEVLHERGFQYSLAVLKAQLATPKWTEILNRKFKNNYYRNSPDINLALFPELENARKQLLTFVDNLRCRDQKAHIEALHGQELSIRVTHFPKVNYGQNVVNKIILEKSGASVLFENKNNEVIKRKVSELILAQINPTKSSPFDLKTRRRIEMVFDKQTSESNISHIAMSLNKTFNVIFKDGKQIPLEDFIPFTQEKEIANKNRDYFELEQVLGSHERGELISYTYQEAPKVHIGTVHHHLENKMIEINIGDGVVTLPLSEVLVDPLQKEDFTNTIKRSA